jgi:DNA-directed RNA polymerase specialized sigma24 family protein
MSQQEDFDSFYRSTRSDVLLQVFLLTGDLTAAAAAVKDAYAITWQHWKKVTLREPPIDHVRPLAYRLAQRRHAGRIWHRNKGLSDEHKFLLDAVHKLSGGERRLLLLVDLAGLELPDAARELAITYAEGENRLGTARAEITATLGTSYVARLRTLAEPASAAKLPRPSIVLRAGRERRRLQTVAAVAGAVALTVAVGVAAREPGLERASAVHQVLPGGKPVGEKLPEGVTLPTADDLLQEYQLSGLAPQQLWDVLRTDNNTRGDGINVICQQTRFADPRGLAALVRTFKAQGKPPRDALQTVEISRDEAAAKQAYDTTIRWFAGCQVARLQMISAYRVTGVGDQADLLQVQVAGDPMSTYNVAVARVRETTTTVVMRTDGGTIPKPAAVAATLGDAVSKLCPSDLDGCAASPGVTAVPPPPSGEEPGFVATVDLPPVGAITEPWVGVASVNALSRADATTRCDRANFGKAGATEARAKTFLIPQADVPETFGFTETYGVFETPKAAAAFLEGVRKSVAGCEERDLTTKVIGEHRETNKQVDLSVWRFDNKVSDRVMVSFRVGFVRVGNRVAKLTFVPDGKNDMKPADFEALVRRAGERLGELAQSELP